MSRFWHPTDDDRRAVVAFVQRPHAYIVDRADLDVFVTDFVHYFREDRRSLNKLLVDSTDGGASGMSSADPDALIPFEDVTAVELTDTGFAEVRFEVWRKAAFDGFRPAKVLESVNAMIEIVDDQPRMTELTMVAVLTVKRDEIEALTRS